MFHLRYNWLFPALWGDGRSAAKLWFPLGEGRPAMTMQDKLAHAAAGAPQVDRPFSPEWWQSRSSDELQAIVHRGIKGGDAFFAAAAEMERRAKEANAATDVQQVAAIKTSRRLGWELKLLFALLALAALAALILLVR
jgi:hypothetical protein